MKIPRGENNQAIESVKAAKEPLLKSMEVEDVWNDSAYERFKDQLADPISCAIDDYLEAATDIYESMSAAVLLGEHLLETCETERMPGLSFPDGTITWIKDKMFPKLEIDEVLYQVYRPD